MSTTTKTTRGCGERKADSIYLESRLSPFGKPVEDFIIDPPFPCYQNGILWSRSYRVIRKPLLDSTGEPVLDENKNEIKIAHLIDWVGEEYYPSVWDFIEEVRDKGVSRRISKEFDLSILTPGKSQIFFAHKRARFDDSRHEYGHPWKFVPPEDRTRITMLTPKNYYPPQEDITTKDKYMIGGRVVGDLKYQVTYDTTLDHSVSALGDGLFFRAYITNIVYVRPADAAKLQQLKELNIDFEIAEA